MGRIWTWRALTIAGVIGSGLAAAPSAAQSLNQKFWLEGALFWPGVDTKARVNSDLAGGIGTEIDFEDDLDFSDRAALPSVSADSG